MQCFYVVGTLTECQLRRGIHLLEVSDTKGLIIQCNGYS